MQKPLLNKFKLFDMLGYKICHPDVRRFHESNAQTKVCCAPRRSTKSYSAAKDALDVILSPNTRTWIVGPNYSLAEKEFRYIHEDLVINRDKLGLPKPLTCYTAARTGQLFIKFAWGSIVEGKTAERPDSLLGEAVDCVIYSEAAQLSRQIRERYVQPTLITKQGREIIPTTPSAEAEWLHELYQIGYGGQFPEVEAFHWDVTANPMYPKEEIDKARKFYGEDSPVFREQYLGEWVFYGGLVYNTYREELHTIDPFEIPKNWPRVIGVDFGHRDPFVTLWCAVGPSQELYFYREYYERAGKSIREHASHIKGLSSGENISLGVADPESPQSIEDLCYEGVTVREGNNDRRAGRLRVLEYLLPTEDGPAPYSLQNLPAGLLKPKKPRLYVFNTCKELTREFKYYRWKERQQKEGDKERTEGDDHCMDVLRYICMTRPSPFRSQVKTPSMSFLGMINRMRNAKAMNRYIGAAVNE